MLESKAQKGDRRRSDDGGEGGSRGRVGSGITTADERASAHRGVLEI
jgi:hypothetical protein